MRRRLGGLAALLLLSCASRRGEAPAAAPEAATDPMGGNGACYVCHMTFVREELSATHLAAGVFCSKCHGVSAGHANDENIGATPPDVTYERAEVGGFCCTCHEPHDVSPADAASRLAELGLSGTEIICTDCHGEHRIAGPAEGRPSTARASQAPEEH